MLSTTPETYAIVLLAAGNSSRMGSPKQLLDFHGKPLLRHAAETAMATGCKVIVVLGARAETVRPALLGLDLEVVLNERWSAGMGTSIQTGLTAAVNRGMKGVVLALADQPFVTAEHLRRLIERHQQTEHSIVAARYSNTVGVPAFFSHQAFSLLFSLGPDQGCKRIILEASLETLLIDLPEAAIDVDVTEDYLRIASL
jgi:molybdenum cofactor cytidylyltransferase